MIFWGVWLYNYDFFLKFSLIISGKFIQIWNLW